MERQTNKIITVDVGGKIFRTYQNTLKKFPETRLGKLKKSDEEYCEHDDKYFFDHSPIIFQYILEFYRSGKLHIPNYICTEQLMEELEYWKISKDCMPVCCIRTFDNHQNEMATIKELSKHSNFSEVLRIHQVINNSQATTFHKWRLLAWMFLEFPTTAAGKITAVLHVCIVLFSILWYILETTPLLREENIWNMTAKRNETLSMSAAERYAHNTYLPLSMIRVDAFFNLYFTIHILTRFILTPKKCAYFKDFLNLVDIAVTSGTWVQLSLQINMWNPSTTMRDQDATLFYIFQIFSLMQPFRICRCYRLGKCFLEVNVIFMAIKKSFKEFLLLGFFMTSSVLFFAIWIYYAEYKYETSQFEHMPMGVWWALITMTTVGYGDVIPTNIPGYIVGGLCALTGIVITGMTISIISSHLTSYYEFVSVTDRIMRRQIESIKLKYQGKKHNSVIPSKNVDEIKVTELNSATL